MDRPVKKGREGAPPAKRRYDSSRRRARAAETQRQVLATALELFLARGYGRTTLAQIASRAGVSVESIYATHGSKANLLRKVWFFAARGDAGDVALFDRPEVQAILAEPDLLRRHEQYAEFVAAFHRRTSPLLDMVTGAAASEPGAVEMLHTWAARRLDVARGLAEQAARTGQLAVTVEEYRDVMYATLNGDLWRELVEGRGWDDQKYASWLAAMWNAQLVARGGRAG